MSRYAKLSLWLIGAWFAAALVLSGAHAFNTARGKPPLPFGLALAVPITVFLVWYAVSPGFREFVLSLNPRGLTLVHSWRLAGFVFLVLATYGILPRFFALSAGWGDIAIGATAVPAAFLLAMPKRRTGFLVWQVLGIADLVDAVVLGILAGVIDPHGIPTSPMTLLPLSLIPTFAVPLMLVLHMISIAQARRWSAEAGRSVGQQRLMEAV